MYADEMTDSMSKAKEETNRRREIQMAYNREHGIEPRTIRKAIRDVLEAPRLGAAAARDSEPGALGKSRSIRGDAVPLDQLMLTISDLEKEMKAAARALEFEQAALLRDEITRLKKLLPKGSLVDEAVTPAQRRAAARAGRR